MIVTPFGMGFWPSQFTSAQGRGPSPLLPPIGALAISMYGFSSTGWVVSGSVGSTGGELGHDVDVEVDTR